MQIITNRLYEYKDNVWHGVLKLTHISLEPRFKDVNEYYFDVIINYNGLVFSKLKLRDDHLKNLKPMLSDYLQDLRKKYANSKKM